MERSGTAGGADPITITTCQAANTEAVCRAITHYLDDRLPYSFRFVDGIPWQERERGLDGKTIHVGWICGSYYVWKVDGNRNDVRLLVAPVMGHARYEDRPVYFSDVIVRHDSPFQCFADLKGARWAYNEPRSYSGTIVVCRHLANQGLDGTFFGSVVESGYHTNSLRMVLEGQVDATAIDSTLLEFTLARAPQLGRQLRVIKSLGPSPIPPLVAFGNLSPQQEEALRQALLAMHRDPAGRTALARGRLARFSRVDDGDYDLIREAVRVARHVRLGNVRQGSIHEPASGDRCTLPGGQESGAVRH